MARSLLPSWVTRKRRQISIDRFAERMRGRDRFPPSFDEVLGGRGVDVEQHGETAERARWHDVAPAISGEQRARRIQSVLGDRLTIQAEGRLAAVARAGDVGM